MNEERRSIKGFEVQYDITRTGRIISKKTKKARHKNGDEYGYIYVHLHKKGSRELHKTFELWKNAFPELSDNEYKGLKAR
ncbi:NUMOD4 domain-containing protein [Fictibacillus barbaricus]|uniref:NUMOD4 domain-containing protein n=1 Tax=Fictibacillus barbaricus TaxID=182136 RepID=A0ABU1U3W7_9BACL|nr:NUMOD4 domain-containing protein [Fictibacillus barbaricus]MDR7074184.1 hypothetical protein [Fictibacillus barbaricus]